MSILPDEVIRCLVPEAEEFKTVARGGVGGGCISEAEWVEVVSALETSANAATQSGVRRLFWKRNAADFLCNFEAEADGLARIAASGQIRTPEVLGVGVVGGQSHLLLSWIERGERVNYTRWGEALARHHRATAGSVIGLQLDNYLGATRQMNTWSPQQGGWVDFVVQCRIEPQVACASDAGWIDSAFKSELQQVMNSMPDLLAGREDRTSLLHGDLWSGNFWSDADGRPVWIDPAVYHGCREAEFGMLELFGNCPSQFMDAYLSEWPLTPGWRRRVDVYVLYHLLNHLNLFGAGYLGSCQSRVRAILRCQ